MDSPRALSRETAEAPRLRELLPRSHGTSKTRFKGDHGVKVTVFLVSLKALGSERGAFALFPTRGCPGDGAVTVWARVKGSAALPAVTLLLSADTPMRWGGRSHLGKVRAVSPNLRNRGRLVGIPYCESGRSKRHPLLKLAPSVLWVMALSVLMAIAPGYVLPPIVECAVWALASWRRILPRDPASS